MGNDNEVILNVTCIVDHSLINKWKGFMDEWLENVKLPLYSYYKIYKVMVYEVQPPSYCVQFMFDGLSILDEFYKTQLPGLEADLSDAFAQDCLVVKTILRPE